MNRHARKRQNPQKRTLQQILADKEQRRIRFQSAEYANGRVRQYYGDRHISQVTNNVVEVQQPAISSSSGITTIQDFVQQAQPTEMNENLETLMRSVIGDEAILRNQRDAERSAENLETLMRSVTGDEAVSRYLQNRERAMEQYEEDTRSMLREHYAAYGQYHTKNMLNASRLNQNPKVKEKQTELDIREMQHKIDELQNRINFLEDPEKELKREGNEILEGLRKQTIEAIDDFTKKLEQADGKVKECKKLIKEREERMQKREIAALKKMDDIADKVADEFRLAMANKLKIMFECCICFDDKLSKNMLALKCGHEFCEGCLQKILRDSTIICPLCRTATRGMIQDEKLKLLVNL